MRCLLRRSSITLILTAALAIAATGAIRPATSEAAAPSGMRLPFVGHVYYYTTAYHTGNMKYARDVVPKPTNAWNGTVVAMAAGKVILAEARDVTTYCPFAPNGRQREVRIEHSIGGRRYMTVYTHLSSYSVRVGQKVSAGQVIGSYGRTGCADGKHLHFEVHSGGTFGNPWSGTNISVDDLPGVKSVGSGPGAGDAVGPAVSSNAAFNWLLGPGDFTGDWCEDIIGRRPNGTLRLYEGNCAGGWGKQNVQIGTGWNGFNWILGPGDFDGDARTDVIARKPDGTLWLYRGNGNGGWVTGHGEKIGTGWGMFNWLLGPGDFSGDGCADVIGRKPDGTLWLYKGNCRGGWLTPHGLKIGTGWGMFDWLLGLNNFSHDPLGGSDFSGDGCADVIGRKPDGTLWLYRGNCGGGWITGHGEKIGTGWGAFNWLLGPSDFTGDGCADLIGRRADRTLRLYEGNCASGWGRQNVVVGTGW